MLYVFLNSLIHVIFSASLNLLHLITLVMAYKLKSSLLCNFLQITHIN